MRKYFSVLLVLLLLIGCSCKKDDSSLTEYFPIGESEKVYDIKERGCRIAEWVFVQNPPSEDKGLIEMMLNYREKHGMEIDSLCILYGMSFFRYNSESAIYLKRDYRNDPYGATYTLGEDYKFFLGTVFIKPCVSDSIKWQLYVDVWYKRDVDYEDYASRRTVIDSCAVMVDNKFVLPE